MVITAMKCFSCDKGVLNAQTVTVTEEIRDEKYTFETPGLICNSCHAIAFEGKDVSEHQRRLADAYRVAHGLLTSIDIRALREKLGMSQLKFAAYLKVGVASIKRWELGAIQDEANDSYIRLKTDLVAAEANCAEIKQIVGKVVGDEQFDTPPKLVLMNSPEERAVSLPSPMCPPSSQTEESLGSSLTHAANTQFAYAA